MDNVKVIFYKNKKKREEYAF
jgi:hypothetical protein